jgi:hypothetical protein
VRPSQPKRKTSLRYDDVGKDLNNSELQRNTRDGTILGELRLGNACWREWRIHPRRLCVKTSRTNFRYRDGVEALNIGVVNNNDVDMMRASR